MRPLSITNSAVPHPELEPAERFARFARMVARFPKAEADESERGRIEGTGSKSA